MENIQMVDLHSQYLKIKSEVDSAIQNIINKTAFVKGEEVSTFEKNLAKYLNVKHVIACGNGTDALQLSLMALDLKPGDQVITPSFTFIATAEVISLLKLSPILIDVDPKSFNIDIKEIENAITPKTKAIIPVHLFGQAAEMDKILAIAKKYNLYVIEDTAQALGSDIRLNSKHLKLGTLGDIGCTSFFPSKNLGAFGDGGAVFTNNDELAEKIRILANHGMQTRYYHDYIGINSRLDGIQAAILNIKLKKLDEYNLARQKAAAFYDNAFANCEYLEIPYRVGTSTHIFHQYTLIVKQNRNALQEFLKSKNIPSMVYYPVPLHLQKVFSNSDFNNRTFANSEKLAKEVLSLPMHTELDNEQLEYITSSVLTFFNTSN